MPTADSNGAGKSLILDAICWVVYGKTLRDISGDDVINNKVKKNCKVAIYIEGNDGEPHIITRIQKGSNGNEILVSSQTFPALKEAQKFITENLFCMSYETFTNCIMFGQNIKKFFAASSDKEQKAILEEIILPHVDFEKALKNIKFQKDKVMFVGEEYKTELRSVEDRIELDRMKCDKLEERQNTFEEKLEERRREITKLTVDAGIKEVKLEKSLAKLRKQLQSLNRRLTEHQEALIVAKNDEANMKDSVGTFLETRAKRNAEYVSLRKSLMDLKEEFVDAKSLKGICNVCGTLITKANKALHCKEIDRKIEELKQELRMKSIDVEDVEKSYEWNKSCYDNATSLVETLRDESLGMERKIMQLNQEYKDLVSEHKRKLNEIETAKKSLEDLSESEGVGNLVAELKTALSVSSKRRRYLSANIKKLEENLEYFKFWEIGFGNAGLKSFIFDSIVPQLTDLSNHYSRILTGGRVLLDFNTQKELKSKEVRDKFEISAINSDGAEVYKGNSGGEKRRIDLCIMLALHSLVEERMENEISFLFFDEVFDNLDTTGSETVMELLEELSSKKESVFVVTHNPELKPYFQNRIKVVKEDGITTLRQAVRC